MSSDDDVGGIVAVRRKVGGKAATKPTPAKPAATATPAASSTTTTANTADSDDEGGIVAVRRNVRGKPSPAVTSSSTAAATTAASSAAAASSSSSAASSSVPATANALPALGAGSGNPNKLRTAFAMESDEVIEARKAAARLPLVRQQLSEDGGTPSEDYYRQDEISIPVRPDWTGKTKAQLEAQEQAYFKEWLESIYNRFGNDRLNHFEHNLEVWRQLWRVCERSDILVVIVDCRQPILNFPPSLYHYITRTLRKPMLLVLNKIDLIPAAALNAWIDYFHRLYPKLFVIPFTSYPGERKETMDHLVKSKAKRGRGTTLLKPYGAEELLAACRKIVSDSNSLQGISAEARRNFSFDPTLLTGGSRAVEKNEQAYADADDYMRVGTADEELESSSSLSKQLKEMGVLKKKKTQQRRQQLKKLAQQQSDDEEEEKPESKKKGKKSVSLSTAADDVHEYSEEEDSEEDDDVIAETSSDLASGVMGRMEDEEDDFTYANRSSSHAPTAYITLGCIGQPNAGKSSLINALAGKKCVSVSKTPGHTKYLQTLFLNKSTRLCDCPGLVFPAVGMPRALQVISGSYPIAQTRDPYSAVQFLAERLPLETIYKLTPPVDPNVHAEPVSSEEEEDDGKRKRRGAKAKPAFEWSAWNLCEALATRKGFFSRQGQPDVYRAANFILREVLDGIITLYFTPPIQK